MAYYQKEIIYLSYKEKGEKVKNAGFVRVQHFENDVKLDMQITGLSALISQKADILIKSADEREIRLGEIEIKGGRGSWEKQIDSTKPFTIWVDLSGEKQIIGSSAMGSGTGCEKSSAAGNRAVGNPIGNAIGNPIGSKIGYSAVDQAGVRSESNPGNSLTNTNLGAAENKADSYLRNGVERLLGEFVGKPREGNAAKAQAESTAKESEETAAKTQADSVGRFLEKSMGKFADFAARRPVQEKTAERETLDQRLSDRKPGREAAEYAGERGIGAAGGLESIRPEKEDEAEQVSPEPSAEKRVNGARINLSEPERPRTEQEIILNDKWKQLMQLYPVIHPYEDEREYLSIQPKDFVVMTGDHQHLANNSFLLHGYYNYRHVILGKEKMNGEEQFFLGVPGVYYEREKMVALMFGFEAFECNGGRAQAGKFGYYLRKVTI